MADPDFVTKILAKLGYEAIPDVTGNKECLGSGSPNSGPCSERCFLMALIGDQGDYGGVTEERIIKGAKSRLEHCRMIRKKEA